VTQVSDEEGDLWARAEAEMHRTPPEPAHRQAARERYDRRLARFSVVLAGAAVALGLLTPLLDPGDDPATWRGVIGLAVVVLGLLLMLFGPLARPFGSRRELTRPLEWLSAKQRKELRQQVRSGDVVPARRPLAQLQARAMIDRRVDGLPQVGLVIGFVGLWIWDHSWPRTVLTSLLVAVTAVMAIQQFRDERLARRFLEEHP
jgi:MFS family permease